MPVDKIYSVGDVVLAGNDELMRVTSTGRGNNYETLIECYNETTGNVYQGTVKRHATKEERAKYDMFSVLSRIEKATTEVPLPHVYLTSDVYDALLGAYRRIALTEIARKLAMERIDELEKKLASRMTPAEKFVQQYISGAQGCEMDCDDAQLLAAEIKALLEQKSQ